MNTKRDKNYSEIIKCISFAKDHKLFFFSIKQEKVDVICQLLEIETIRQLERACKENKISNLDGFEISIEKKILAAIFFYGMRHSMPEETSEDPLTIRKIVFSPIDSFLWFFEGGYCWGGVLRFLLGLGLMMIAFLIFAILFIGITAYFFGPDGVYDGDGPESQMFIKFFFGFIGLLFVGVFFAAIRSGSSGNGGGGGCGGGGCGGCGGGD
jgi:hypothetical protein